MKPMYKILISVIIIVPVIVGAILIYNHYHTKPVTMYKCDSVKGCVIDKNGLYTSVCDCREECPVSGSLCQTCDTDKCCFQPSSVFPNYMTKTCPPSGKKQFCFKTGVCIDSKTQLDTCSLTLGDDKAIYYGANKDGSTYINTDRVCPSDNPNCMCTSSMICPAGLACFFTRQDPKDPTSPFTIQTTGIDTSRIANSDQFQVGTVDISDTKNYPLLGTSGSCIGDWILPGKTLYDQAVQNCQLLNCGNKCGLCTDCTTCDSQIKSMCASSCPNGVLSLSDRTCSSCVGDSPCRDAYKPTTSSLCMSCALRGCDVGCVAGSKDKDGCEGCCDCKSNDCTLCLPTQQQVCQNSITEKFPQTLTCMSGTIKIIDDGGLDLTSCNGQTKCTVDPGYKNYTVKYQCIDSTQKGITPPIGKCDICSGAV